MLDIVKAPNPALSQKAKPVPIKSGPVGKIDITIISLINEMKNTLSQTKDPEGVGLAAPQVGESLRIFIAKPTPKSSNFVFINPKVIAHPDPAEEQKQPSKQKKKRKSKAKLEGCLSLINIWGVVKRSPKVKVGYLDENGKKRYRVFTGFLATIIQHEDDHLNGILFPKRVLEQKGKLYKSHKNEKGQTVFEEIEL